MSNNIVKEHLLCLATSKQTKTAIKAILVDYPNNLVDEYDTIKGVEEIVENEDAILLDHLMSISTTIIKGDGNKVVLLYLMEGQEMTLRESQSRGGGHG